MQVVHHSLALVGVGCGLVIMGSTIPSIDTSVINRQSMVSEVADYLQNYCSFISADTVEILFSQEVDGGDFFDLTDETLLTHFPNITFGQRKKIMFIVVAHKTSAGPDGGGSCTDDTLGCKPLGCNETVENNAGSSASSGTSLASYTIRKRVRKPKVSSDRKRRKEIDADSVDPIDVLAVLSSKKIGMNVIEFVRVHKRINKTHQENMMKMLYEHVSKDATSPEKYYPENSLKIAMAKGIVMAFPELKDDGDQPWKSWYKKVKTKFETLQAKLPPEKKKYQHVKGKEIDQQDNTNPEESSSSSSTDNSFSPESDNLLDNLVAWMNDAIPNTANKKEISLALKSTFDMRTAWIKTESPSCSEILLKYKHLISYSGEMISEEFSRKEPLGMDLEPRFCKVAPSIWKLFTQQKPHLIDEVSDRFQDVNVKALVVLPKLLPPHLSTRTSTEKVLTHIKAFKTIIDGIPSSALLQVSPVGVDPEAYVSKEYCEEENMPVFPFILWSTNDHKSGDLYLKIDRKTIWVSSYADSRSSVNPVVKAVSAAVKAAHIFNLAYHPQLKNVYCYLELLMGINNAPGTTVSSFASAIREVQ